MRGKRRRERLADNRRKLTEPPLRPFDDVAAPCVRNERTKNDHFEAYSCERLSVAGRLGGPGSPGEPQCGDARRAGNPGRIGKSGDARRSLDRHCRNPGRSGDFGGPGNARDSVGPVGR